MKTMNVYELIIEKLKRDSCKKDNIIRVYSEWKMRNDNGFKVSEFLRKQKINSIGIYGLGMLGRSLAQELINDEFEVAFISDKYYKRDWNGYQILDVLDEWPSVDAIVFTQLSDTEKLCEEIFFNHKEKILSIEDIIYGKI